jgi:(p)ppGpp synthase/HD superfamily hydrolase
LAERIAREAHAGQVDKAGRDYRDHPRRVALAVEHLGPVAVAAAWLHDVVEDTPWTPVGLREHLPSEVVDIVALLTRQADQHPDDYYAQVRTHPTALAIKLADIADNADPARFDELDPALADRLRAKYTHALEALQQ